MVSYEDFAAAPESAVLQLLAQEAPRSYFEDLLHQAETHFAADELIPLERSVRLALTVHAHAERFLAREKALLTFVDTARDMSASRDSGDLLVVITARARWLLGFDMAFISLSKPDGGSYIHSSDGETTSFNVGLQIQGGYGVGEVAQRSKAPFWTADYLGDDSFPHSERVDEVVRGEGLRAILTSPMISGNVTVGALYGGNRKVRHFTPDEVSLMRALGDLAAAMLGKSRSLGRMRAELADLGEDNSRQHAMTVRMRSLCEARDMLIGSVLGGAEVCEVAEMAGRALGGTGAAYDSAGLLLSGSGLPDIAPALVAEAIQATSSVRAPVQVADALWAVPSILGAGGTGVLLIRTSTPVKDDEIDFLQFVERAVGLMALLQRGAVAAGPMRDELLDDLLVGPRRSPRRLAALARRLGVDQARPHSVVIVRPEADDHAQAVMTLSSYARRKSGLKTARSGDIILLLPEKEPSVAAETVHRELTRQLTHPVSVSAAGSVGDLSGIGDVYQEAQRCLEALIILGGRGTAAVTDDLGFLGLLLSDHNDVDRYVRSTLGGVLECDERRRSELIRTLDAYFASHASPSRAAVVLHVHPNTVSRRLERLTGLLGEDWREPARALEIQLALRLLHTRRLLLSKQAPGSNAQADSSQS
ncbi:helix-turn-helix domain-containing protein [Streptomyces sp. AM 4-1-1]|uniref:helix-turn-helix domain-containing protein n=1 Tax=Streptomyces sp. AM 4-1-1 TaxID=3028710 RepID=UPI0023BA0A74|nr:helix-turn-helix domain-containing protein [Streptomyces sp. AM 4-1-1]WEH36705.1 helix-turn-helix domain-containing protein [Streptomyces sp. AM 4-1-1]